MDVPLPEVRREAKSPSTRANYISATYAFTTIIKQRSLLVWRADATTMSQRTSVSAASRPVTGSAAMLFSRRGCTPVDLVRLLKWGAPVRVLLQEAEARELCFVRELLGDFSVDVATSRSDEDPLTFLPSLVETELIVIARDTWRHEDTEVCRRLHALRLGPPLLSVSCACATED